MARLQDPKTTDKERVVSREEQEHNARINERYNEIKNAVEGQFAKRTVEMPIQQSTPTYNNMHSHTSMYGYTPTLEQRPMVKEYINNLMESIYSSEAMRGPNYVAQQPAIEPIVEENVAPVEVVAEEKVAVESYSITPFAKLAIAVFSVIVVAMMSLIGINTKILEEKAMRINELEAHRQELIEQNAAVERRIAEAKSEETIRQYAESQGMIEID